VAEGRILLVHGSGSTRALMSHLLEQEGCVVETAENSYDCIARFVEEPADLVLVGLESLRESELDMVRTLAREDPRPRILITFPMALREFAVKALAAGADSYLLEPFYAEELVSLACAQLGEAKAPARTVDLPLLARDVAHAVNNPLQVVSLLLGDEKTPKKKLVEQVTAEIARVRDVVQLLERYGSVKAAETGAADIVPLVEKAATGRVRLKLEVAGEPRGRIDEQLFLGALHALFDAIGARYKGRKHLEATLEDATLTVSVPRDAFAGEDPEQLERAVFGVRDDRTVVPGLALVHSHLDPQGGTLDVEMSGETLAFTVTVPNA
jgi:DNA-binding response OmpR family regulator